MKVAQADRGHSVLYPVAAGFGGGYVEFVASICGPLVGRAANVTQSVAPVIAASLN